VLFDKLDTGKVHGLRTCRVVLYRDVTSQVELGLTAHSAVVIESLHR